MLSWTNQWLIILSWDLICWSAWCGNWHGNLWHEVQIKIVLITFVCVQVCALTNFEILRLFGYTTVTVSAVMCPRVSHTVPSCFTAQPNRKANSAASPIKWKRIYRFLARKLQVVLLLRVEIEMEIELPFCSSPSFGSSGMFLCRHLTETD